jgi:hypothetical protein
LLPTRNTSQWQKQTLTWGERVGRVSKQIDPKNKAICITNKVESKSRLVEVTKKFTPLKGCKDGSTYANQYM